MDWKTQKRRRRRHDFDTLFPELQGMPKEVRDHLADRYRQFRVWSKPQWWARWFFPMAVIVIWFFVRSFMPRDNSVMNYVDDVVLYGLILLAVFLVPSATRVCIKQQVQNELHRLQIRIPACLMCNYDLRGTPDESTACPECGAVIAAVGGDSAGA